MSATTTPKITGQRKRDALAAALNWVESYEGMTPDGGEALLGVALREYGADALLKHADEDGRAFPADLIDAAVLLRQMTAPRPWKVYEMRLVNRTLGWSAKINMASPDARRARTAAREHAVAEWGGTPKDWKVETTAMTASPVETPEDTNA